MTYGHDPLDDLLSMNLNEVFDLVKMSYTDYTEVEGWSSEVAKIKALEDFHLWYREDKEKEINLRKLVSQL